MAETLGQAQKRADFYRQRTVELEALIGYLHKLSKGDTDLEIVRDGEGTDDGWSVTLEDGNGDTVTGRFYPRSDVDELALFIERHQEHSD